MEDSLARLEEAPGWKLPPEYRRYQLEGQYWADFFSPQEALEELREWEHTRSVPIGGDGLGSMYVLGADGVVYFWDHEKQTAELEPLRDSLKEFMDEGLREFQRWKQNPTGR